MYSVLVLYNLGCVFPHGPQRLRPCFCSISPQDETETCPLAWSWLRSMEFSGDCGEDSVMALLVFSHLKSSAVQSLPTYAGTMDELQTRWAAQLRSMSCTLSMDALSLLPAHFSFVTFARWWCVTPSTVTRVFQSLLPVHVLLLFIWLEQPIGTSIL